MSIALEYSCSSCSWDIIQNQIHHTVQRCNKQSRRSLQLKDLMISLIISKLTLSSLPPSRECAQDIFSSF
uniref:Uncharacterized protein n=1 Tax=Aegilops tauschii subsp. strangulata TaxID=200361 RepID=A0A453KEC5_AEGTS